ncbi:response regulator [Aurantimonas sp. 22II-16-19i]|uniref:response regulator n=1 Tax=Aurantimonas sp. 22II-16-19i TaxID=1317114 RepID=UPI0009F7FC65|nr:response regulator [Aurantimonas sp. 22II-16-19i]ORE90245.1 response regulator receiver domain-containing protein [Aurantimonas sp. 22II-16-19i]
MADILLVEDDDYKLNDIQKVIDLRCRRSVERAASVTAALRAVSLRDYELVVLDMSLPTFDISGPGGGGSPQGQGGIEVLRLAGRLRNKSRFVIVTQYPDIEINGYDISLSDSGAILSEKFGLNIVDCILYEFDKPDWQIPFIDIVQRIGLK